MTVLLQGKLLEAPEEMQVVKQPEQGCTEVLPCKRKGEVLDFLCY